MDKIAANNHFVILRKEIKKAKAMVSGNLIRKIKESKKEIESVEDETKKCKLQNKIDGVYEDIKSLKTLDSYLIAKQATLKPDKGHWNKLSNHSKVSREERLTAIVICKNNIQRQVSKFREDHKDCDEWLDEYIEFREKKNELLNPGKKFKKFKKVGNESSNKNQGRNTNKPDTHNKTNRRTNERSNFEHEEPSDREEQKSNTSLTLHPSWESKRKEKELLKAALSGKNEQPKRITF